MDDPSGRVVKVYKEFNPNISATNKAPSGQPNILWEKMRHNREIIRSIDESVVPKIDEVFLDGEGRVLAYSEEQLLTKEEFRQLYGDVQVDTSRIEKAAQEAR